MASDFEVKVEKNYDAAKKLLDSLTPIATGVKTHANNYDQACKMYFASEDHILELEGKIKTNPKLADELKKWESNHPKLAQRVKNEYAECQKLRAGVTMASKAWDTVNTTHKGLVSGAARAVMTNVIDTQTNLKLTGEMLGKAEKEIKRLDNVLTNCMPYPKTLK